MRWACHEHLSSEHPAQPVIGRRLASVTRASMTLVTVTRSSAVSWPRSARHAERVARDALLAVVGCHFQDMGVDEPMPWLADIVVWPQGR